MNVQRRQISKPGVERQNYFQKHWIRHTQDLLTKLTEDKDRKKRREGCLCKMCFYRKSRIGGSAMTTAACAFCKKETTFGNTAVDIICEDCAKIAELCKHCGADLDYVNRRNREFPEVLP